MAVVLCGFAVCSSHSFAHFAAGIFVRFSDWIQYTMIHFRSQAIKQIIVSWQSPVVSVRMLHVQNMFIVLKHILYTFSHKSTPVVY
ncbi:MAG TPA: hypothetical protein PKA81_10580 [Clostridia bacterium]|nr:hypothetical protein [Clostridia bacterium]